MVRQCFCQKHLCIFCLCQTATFAERRWQLFILNVPCLSPAALIVCYYMFCTVCVLHRLCIIVCSNSAPSVYHLFTVCSEHKGFVCCMAIRQFGAAPRQHLLQTPLRPMAASCLCSFVPAPLSSLRLSQLACVKLVMVSGHMYMHVCPCKLRLFDVCGCMAWQQLPVITHVVPRWPPVQSAPLSSLRLLHLFQASHGFRTCMHMPP